MRELKLVGLSTDGRQVQFVDAAGEKFAAAADDRLRGALRGDRARLGQAEIERESALRPRDIQARIRSGATPEEVAAAAEVPVEKVLAYCLPVLAERQHMAELARRSHVRRRNTEGPSRRLIDVVAERLASRGIDPDSVSWDAWRRDDSRWTVRASYEWEDSEHTGMLVYDAAGRYCVADDDEARWLTGERPTRQGQQPPPHGQGERRLSAVPTGDDLRSNFDDEELTDDLTAVVRAIAGPEAIAQAFHSEPVADVAVTVDADGYPRPDVRAGGDTAAVVKESAPPTSAADTDPEASSEAIGTEGEAQGVPATPEQAPQPATPPAETALQQSEADPIAESAEPLTEPVPDRRRRPGKRASVPSWDEIMLGGGADDGSAP